MEYLLWQLSKRDDLGLEIKNATERFLIRIGQPASKLLVNKDEIDLYKKVEIPTEIKKSINKRHFGVI